MEDGTVEYMPVFYAIKNNSIKSYGKVDNSISNVLKLANYGVCPRNADVGCMNTVLAQRTDGKYYDLFKFIEKSDYYNY